MDKSYLKKKINKLNKKIHRAESQNEENKTWWRKLKLTKLKQRLNHTDSWDEKNILIIIYNFNLFL